MSTTRVNSQPAVKAMYDEMRNRPKGKLQRLAKLEKSIMFKHAVLLYAHLYRQPLPTAVFAEQQQLMLKSTDRLMEVRTAQHSTALHRTAPHITASTASNQESKQASFKSPWAIHGLQSWTPTSNA